MKKLNPWFKIDDKKYCWYILQGYEIVADEKRVEWWLNGQLHRTTGPAWIYSNGTQAWYLNDMLHRTDGPAVISSSGTQFWYLNGKEFTEDEWRQQVETELLV